MPARPVCNYCGKPVQGQYLSALNAIWHPDHFLCGGCGQPVRDASFNVHEGKPYHTTCFTERVLPRCPVCKKPVTGTYMPHKGASYHPECYRESVAPRCAYCNKPLIKRYVTAEGKQYHEACYREHVVPRCAYCNEPLLGRFLSDAWGNSYCEKHQKEYPRCDFCGRLIPPAQQERGRNLNSVRCPVCRQGAIETLSQAIPLFAGLEQWMRAQGLHFGSAKLNLELCDRAALASLRHSRGSGKPGEPDTLGITRSTMHTVNGREVGAQVDGISILHGLPPTLFQGVAAHELGHAWLVIHGIRGLPAWAEEGFCELLAHRYWSGRHTAESRFHAGNIEKNPDPIYGEGFRKVRALADRLGFKQFIETLRATKRLPS